MFGHPRGWVEFFFCWRRCPGALVDFFCLKAALPWLFLLLLLGDVIIVLRRWASSDGDGGKDGVNTRELAYIPSMQRKEVLL